MKKKRFISIVILIIAVFSLFIYKYFLHITLADYTNIKLEKQNEEVTEKELNSKIDEMLKKYKKPVKRKAKTGDVVVFSRSAEINGKEVNDLHSVSEELKLGEDIYAEGFDKNLTGLKKGEKRIFQFQFKANASQKSYVGKKCRFEVVIKNVYEIPKLTDKFVKDNFFYANVSEMKKILLKDLKEKKSEEVQASYKMEAWKYIMKHSKVRYYPTSILDTCHNRIEKYYRSCAQNQNLKWDDFIEINFETKEKYNEILDKTAREQTKEQILIEKIAKKENIKYTDSQYKKKAKSLAKIYGFSSLKEFEKNNSKSIITNYLLKEDILKIILKKAKVK